MAGMSIGRIAIDKRYPEIGIANGETILFMSEVVVVIGVLSLLGCIDCQENKRKEERSESDGNNVQSGL